ncbi:MAG: TMEM175 family protein, partial [Actinomycetes bacterium]
MTKSIKDISHKAIDTLSDGVFSIALTLLGIDVVALVPKLTHSGDVLGSLIEHLPTFLAFFLGFVVLFSWWYAYHVSGQYV